MIKPKTLKIQCLRIFVQYILSISQCIFFFLSLFPVPLSVSLCPASRFQYLRALFECIFTNLFLKMLMNPSFWPRWNSRNGKHAFFYAFNVRKK